MSLETQIGLVTVPQEFSRLCNAVLQAEHGDDFVPIDDDRADGGNDGFLKSEHRIFAVHCFKRAQNQSLDAAIKRKAIGDLGKAIALKQAGMWDVDAWTFISNYPMPEPIAQQMVAIGRQAGIDVSWKGTSYLALALQRHPEIRPGFPALQVNEITEKLDGLRDELQKDRKSSMSCTDFGVPESWEQINLVKSERPLAWEYRLFAGLLKVGLKEREFKWRDFELGISGHPPIKLSRDEFSTYFGAAFARIEGITEPFMRPFDASAQERAFGPPGEPGDVGSIEHFAGRILIAYEAMLDWVAELRAVHAESPFERLVALAPGYMKGPASQIRASAEKLCAQLNGALQDIERRGPNDDLIVIEVDFILEIDPAVIAEFDKEVKRAQRRLREGY